MSVENNIKNISESEVERAQQNWADALVHIGHIYQNNGDYKGAASEVIDRLYAYNYDKKIVLFKPTKAKDIPFRGTKEGALSYFVAGNNKYSEDQGFALAPWVSVEFNNNQIYMHDDIAIAMGEYIFSNASNEQVKVEYTFGYVKDEQGELRIVLHHSSLPYQDV